MADKKVLLVGCGDIGISLGQSLLRSGFTVWGLRRNTSLLTEGFHPITADITEPRSLQQVAEQDWDYVVVTLVPAGFNDEGYRSIFVEGVNNLISSLHIQPKLRRLLFVSSSSVYHQKNGEWVDEQSPTEPTSFSGKRLLQGEQLLQQSSLPATVVRFSGIYGPGRRRLIDQVLAGQGCEKSPPLYTNRIHQQDCVGFLQHLIEMNERGIETEACYLATDSSPVTMWDVKQWLASQLEVVLGDTSPESKMRRSSKRCSNQKMLATGYELRYPNFQQGYAELLKSLI